MGQPIVANLVKVIVLENSESVLIPLSHREFVSLVTDASHVEDVFISHAEDILDLGVTSLDECSSQWMVTET
jgi:hypothetical protein